MDSDDIHPRDLPIVIIGHIDHSKANLAAVVAHVQARLAEGQEIIIVGDPHVSEEDRLREQMMEIREEIVIKAAAFGPDEWLKPLPREPRIKDWEQREYQRPRRKRRK